jgi:hypothetical protein
LVLSFSVGCRAAAEFAQKAATVVRLEPVDERFMTVLSFAPVPVVQLAAPVQFVPGTRMSWVAPAVRIDAMAPLAASSHVWTSMSWGSFISPNTTSALLL